MDTSAFDSLKAFIVEKAGIDENEIAPETRLYEDLGIYGDDAFELLVGYGKKFNVDVTKLMAADYFAGEGELFAPVLIKLFTGKRPESNLKVLTVKHLEKGIVAGRLDEEIINNEISPQ
jgi:acyl carrier protein